jgi:hypothetical protein
MSKKTKDKVKTSDDLMVVSNKILYHPENFLDESLRHKLVVGLSNAGEVEEEINISVTAEEFKRLLEICESVS